MKLQTRYLHRAGRLQKTNARHKRRQQFLRSRWTQKFEALEDRVLLAADFGISSDDALIASTEVAAIHSEALLSSSSPSDHGNILRAEGEATSATNLNEFVQILGERTRFYGAFWCSACQRQKNLFAAESENLPFIEVTAGDPNDLGSVVLNDVGLGTDLTLNPTGRPIESFPTWERISDGERMTGVHTIGQLAEFAGIPLPSNIVSIDTNLFDFDLELRPDITPLTVDNFLNYANSELGETEPRIVNSFFHRLVNNFVLQGGGFSSNSTTFTNADQFEQILTDAPVQNEFDNYAKLAGTEASVTNGSPFISLDPGTDLSDVQIGDRIRIDGRFDGLLDPSNQSQQTSFFNILSVDDTNDTVEVSSAPTDASQTSGSWSIFPQVNVALTVAMAKLGGNPDSATNQFFINLANNDANLDLQNGGFTVFASILDPGILTNVASLSTTNAEPSNPFTPFSGVPVFGDELMVIQGISGSGSVSGTKFNDLDGDGQRDPDEEGLEGYTIFSDANDNGSLDANEFSTETDTDGNYTLQLPNGIHTIREIQQTGLATTVPNNPDFYLVQVDIGGQSNGIDFGSIAINSPDAPILQASSDSGITDDGITNKNNSSPDHALRFLVTGVSDGATVTLRADAGNGPVTLGTGVANSEIVVVTNGFTPLPDGPITFTATQTVNNVESSSSAGTVIRIDTQASITSVAPSNAEFGQTFTYDADSTDENNGGAIYSLGANTPAGVTIEASSGELTWTPTGSQIGNHQFDILLSDVAGNSSQQTLNLSVEGTADITYRFEFTDDQGSIVDDVDVGQSVTLTVFVEHTSDDPTGVFAGFLDIIVPVNLVPLDDVNHEFSPISIYTVSQSGDASTVAIADLLAAETISQEVANHFAGPNVVLFDEAGGASSITTPIGSGEFPLLSIPFQAAVAGNNLHIVGDAPDQFPDSFNLVFNEDDPINLDQVNFGDTSLTINLTFGANGDIFNVDEDVSEFELDLLSNDELFPGSTGTELLIESVTQPENGLVTISPDQKSVFFTPTQDFFGETNFSYTINDGTESGTDNGTVVVQVHPVNDPPNAVDDNRNVDEDSTSNFFDVLLNDNSAPDGDENLSIVATTTPSEGGSVSIGPGGTHLLYDAPTDFNGTETFTYTLDDGNGGTDTATVTTVINIANDPPVARDISFNATEDSTNNSLAPLANDDTGPDADETLSIVSVQEFSAGGNAEIIDSTTLSYTPAADFFGSETFTYTISDGNGGFATATATVDVANLNDPPTANDDTFAVIKGVTTELDVLLNDTFTPDQNEVLTVVDFTTPSEGGQVFLRSDGAAFDYIPPTNDTIGTETFTYIVDDGNGETDQATVTIDLLDFTPRTISGAVQSGLGSSPLGGLQLTLEGTDVSGNSLTQQIQTLANGSYAFPNLAPGSYSVEMPALPFLSESPDPLNIESAESDSDNTENDLVAPERRTEFVGIRDFLGRSRRSSILASIRPGDSQSWYNFGAGWSEFIDGDLQLSQDGSSLDLTVTEANGTQLTTSIDMQSTEQVQHLGVQDNHQLIRLTGDSTDFSFTPVTETSAASLAEDALENSLQPEGESPPSDLPFEWRELDNRLQLQGEGEFIGSVEATPVMPTVADNLVVSPLTPLTPYLYSRQIVSSNLFSANPSNRFVPEISSTEKDSWESVTDRALNSVLEGIDQTQVFGRHLEIPATVNNHKAELAVDEILSTEAILDVLPADFTSENSDIT